MMGINTRFCQYLLRGARSEAKKAGVAMRSDRKQFFVEADGMQGEYVEADNAYEAKAKFIYAYVDRMKPED